MKNKIKPIVAWAVVEDGTFKILNGFRKGTYLITTKDFFKPDEINGEIIKVKITPL